MAKQSPSYHFAPGDTVSAAGKHSQPYPWEQRKPKNYLRESRILGSTGVDAKKLTVKLWGKGVVEKKESISGSSNTRYYIRHAGQLMYGKLDFLHAAFGIVPKELDKYESTADSPAFDIIDGNPKFLLESFLRKEFYLRNGQRANGSRKAKRIHEKDFLEMPILVPYKSEQTKIGNLINSLDKTITLHEEQHRQLERLKKALLQKMFADETGYPALRFKGFTAKWEQRKLGDITRRYDNLRVPVTASKRKHGDIPYYGANGIQDFVSGYTHDGEFILVAEDGARDPKNYPVNYVNGKIWVNNHAHVLQGIQGLANNLFLLNGIKKINIVAYLVGGSRAKLNAETLMQLSIKLPSIHEQEKIGQLFQSLDKTITLHDKKIQYLKQLKRGLLQKMFV
ncbi:restriction endonuclease subunit S [Limosilactobacillus mucosae]|uniref:restriction endonuclease subunit S n=1 Tax=Limosilactobacillus mucosae TaxID=97478 RepID=UPI001ED99893|nr:restriction endonuclease subunit S [Limosilactobacillus mucosae]